MTLFKGSGGSAAIQFSLSNGTTEIPGTRVIQTIGNNEYENISISKLINLTASQLVSVQSPIANPNFAIMGNTANLIVELIK
jgi:predicted phosphohydrolase